MSFTMMQPAPAPVTGPWSATMALSAAESHTVYQVLGSTVRTPRAYGQVLRCLQAVLMTEFTRETGKTKQGAATIAKTVIEIVKATVHFAAKTPSIAGDIRGVSLENARIYATKARDSLIGVGGQVRGAPPTPTTKYLLSGIGWGTLSLTTSTYLDLMSGFTEVANERGQITSEAIATALGVKVQYYPRAIAAILAELQTRYDALPLPPTAAALLKPILAGGGLADESRLNGVCGHFQCAAHIIAASVIPLHPQLYRRDPRPVYDRAGKLVHLDDHVIAFSTHQMRAAIGAALAMSIELGDAVRVTKGGAIGTAGPKTSYKVRYGTPFAALLELAMETKRYYNPAGVKDLAQYITDTGAKATLLSENITWKSVKRNDKDGCYEIATPSVPLEVEARTRITEYNNDGAVIPPGADHGPAKPSSKDVKLPNFTYFMRAPREIIDAVAVLQNSQSFDQFKADAGLRQDTARRFKVMLDARGGNVQQFIADVTRLAQEITKVCENITLMHHASVLSESSRLAAAAKAKVTKLPRM